jgi:phospholipid/cholesterol/gamma-HCH transport system substrate-binding protein
MAKIFMHHRVLGVVFIGILALGLWFVSAMFNQKFVSFDEVTLKTGTVGLQLPERADVKARGVIVGQVQKIETNGSDSATLTLGIKPSMIHQIPSNVTGAILPKTLFGEKYVELNIPEQASAQSLEPGDHINKTQLPIEVEKVLNDLYPVLRTIQPAELNYTLNALADALEGRGEKLGEGFVTLDSYLKRLNPQMPALIKDIKLLATVTDTYADVTPDLAATLRNTTKTGNTLVSRQAKLHSFLDDMAGFSDTATAFLRANGNNIIRLGQLSEPILALLARYSPEYPCLLKGIVGQVSRLADTFRGFIFHINLKTLRNQPRAYTRADRQVYGDTRGPNCAHLPNPPVPYYPRGGLFPNLNDGANNLGKGDNQRVAPGFASRGAARSAAAGQTRLSIGPSGTGEQKALINSLTAPALGVPVDQLGDINALLLTPSFAGTEVSVR